MTKIVYNACHGGFGLSKEAVLRYAELKGIKLYEYVEPRWKNTGFYMWIKVPQDEYDKMSIDEQHEVWFHDRDLDRADPILVQVVEELGEKASGRCARLEIQELPKGTMYRITEYDGFESVETRDAVDWKVA
jgi:hypothetical protein